MIPRAEIEAFLRDNFKLTGPQRQLLAYLADRDRPVSMYDIRDDLFRDRNEQNAAQHIRRMRVLLEDTEYRIVTVSGYVLERKDAKAHPESSS